MLADLTRVNEWDRGVTDADQLTGEGIGLAATYGVTVTGFDGKPTRVVYEITEYEAPERFVMVGEHATFRAHDVLTLADTGDGCELTYEGSLELRGDDRPFGDDQLDKIFGHVAGVAESGLRAFLNP